MKNARKKQKLIRPKLTFFENIDRGLLGLTLALTIFGTLAVADASAPQAQNFFGDPYYYVKQQLVWGFIGIIALLISSRIHYSVWEKFAVPLFVGTVVALFLVLIPGIGIKVLGARRWLGFGDFSFQPSEVVKLTLAIYFAKLASVKKEIKTYFIILGVITGLIMMQPDLGTTIIVVGIGFIQIFVTGAPLLTLAGFVAGGGLLGLVLILTSGYRRERLLTFFSHTRESSGTSYHISQVLIALGSGGLFGVGIGQSRQKYLFLPESATDSVFAVISEEVGFLGSLAIILLFCFFIYKGIRIARNAPDRFGTLLATGIVSWIGIQFSLNISSMVALTPLTGVPLPFFSYGGTSLTMILLGVGILLNISKYAKH